MKNLKIILALFSILIIFSCSKDEETIEINKAPVLNDVTVDLRGLGVMKSDLITTIKATDANENKLIYSIVSQTRVGRAAVSIVINASTGEVFVEEPSSFEYDKTPNNIFEAEINVSDGELNAKAKLTINITDPS